MREKTENKIRRIIREEINNFVDNEYKHISGDIYCGYGINTLFTNYINKLFDNILKNKSYIFCSCHPDLQHNVKLFLHIFEQLFVKAYLEINKDKFYNIVDKFEVNHPLTTDNVIDDIIVRLRK